MFFTKKIDPYILAIGHSHLFSLEMGYKQFSKEFSSSDKVKFISMQDSQYSGLALTYDQINSEFIFNKSITEEIQSNSSHIKFIISFFGGNSHNILGLVKNPLSFDFIYPEKLNLPLDLNATFLPFSLVQDVMRQQGGFPETVGSLKFLRKIYNGEIIQIESPPPIYSNEYLLEFSGPFKEAFEQYGISPPFFRYKLWRVYSQLIKEECNKLNIEYLPCPMSMISEQGFLANDGLERDPTHANSQFGREVLMSAMNKNASI
jgi:hypothetical protein